MVTEWGCVCQLFYKPHVLNLWKNYCSFLSFFSLFFSYKRNLRWFLRMLKQLFMLNFFMFPVIYSRKTRYEPKCLKPLCFAKEHLLVGACCCKNEMSFPCVQYSLFHANLLLLPCCNKLAESLFYNSLTTTVVNVQARPSQELCLCP